MREKEREKRTTNNCIDFNLLREICIIMYGMLIQFYYLQYDGDVRSRVRFDPAGVCALFESHSS